MQPRKRLPPQSQKNREAKVALYYTTRLKRQSTIFWTQIITPLIGLQFWNFVYAKISSSQTNSRWPRFEIPFGSENMDFVTLPIWAYDFSIFFLLSFFFFFFFFFFFQRYLRFTISQLLFDLGLPNLVHSFLMTIPIGVFRFILKFLFFIEFSTFEICSGLSRFSPLDMRLCREANSPGARWVLQKKLASEKMSVPMLSKEPQEQEKIRYFRKFGSEHLHFAS